MRRISLIILFAAGLLPVLWSCNDYKDCNSPVDTNLGIQFYQEENGREADSSLPALTMYGIGREDSLLADRQNLRRIFVPLRQTTDSTSFYLQPDSTVQGGDTLTVSYTRDLHFVSAGCGFTTFYTLDTIRYTTHYIDSAALPVKTINTNNATNIKIYY